MNFATSFFKASLRACADWCHKLLRHAEHFIWLQQNLSDSHYVSTSESTYKNKIWGSPPRPVQVVGGKVMGCRSKQTGRDVRGMNWRQVEGMG